MIRQFVVLIFIALLVVGCSGAPETETPAPGEGETPTEATEATTAPDAYPEPQQEQEESYPAPQSEEGYPSPDAATPEFTINRPVTTADTEVTGTGPAGVDIELVNLTRDGEIIGQTTVNDDGTFAIDATGNLVARNELGLVLAGTAAPDATPGELEDRPGYQQTAAGIVVATAIVQEAAQ
jgi:hypothetical protein